MANKNEAKVKFIAETEEFNKQIKSAGNTIGGLKADFKLLDAEMKANGTSIEGLQAKSKNLTAQLEATQDKTKALADKLELAKKYYGENSDEALKYKNQLVASQTAEIKLQKAINDCNSELKDFGKELNDAENAADDLSKAINDVDDKAKDAGDGGFTVLKGALANLTSDVIQGAIGKINEFASSLLELPEATRELRQDLATLDTAFENVGFGVETAKNTWKELYSVLGEDDRSVEAANNIARMAKNQEQLNDWVTITTGVWGTYQDALPVEALAESAGETAKVGKVTGNLADALNWSSEAAQMFAGYMGKDVTNAEDAFNKALSECNTEANRQALITKTLTKLYGKSAESYKKTAKNVIEANKATADLTIEQAKLGDAVEPVTTDITELKNELLKGLSPAIKKNVLPEVKDFFGTFKKDDTIEKFSKGASNLTKNILPPLAKGVKFAAENIDTLAGVTLGAITAYKTFDAAMAVTTSIKATTTAVQGLSAGVGLATKAQTIWNAAMTTNPIGAVLTAVGLLTAGVMLLSQSLEDAGKDTDLLSESQREAVNAAKEQADAYAETKKQADDLAASEMANVDYVSSNLLPQLQNIVDSNGKVKKGYEERAQFILGELNNALGTEYTKLGDIVDKNGQIKDSIYKVIEAKKAQILLEVYEDSYREAVKSVADAEKARAIQAQEIAQQQEIIEQKSAELQEAKIALSDKVANAKNESDQRMLASEAQYVQGLEAELEKQQGILEDKTTAYNESEANLKSYYDIIDSYETASTAVLKGETDKAVSLLNDYSSGFVRAKDVVAKTKKEQIDILKQQVIDTEVNLGLIKADYKKNEKNLTDEQKKQMQQRIDNAKKQAQDAKAEYAKVGGNSIEGMAKGVKDGEWKLTGSLKNAVNNALNAAKKALGIKSPSRVFKKEVGLNIDYGIAGGVEEGTKSIVNSIQKQKKVLTGAYSGFSIANPAKTFNAPNLEVPISAKVGKIVDEGLQMANMQRLADKVDALANRPTVLNINGRRFATATAGDTDSVNGNRLNLKERGLAQ